MMSIPCGGRPAALRDALSRSVQIRPTPLLDRAVEGETPIGGRHCGPHCVEAFSQHDNPGGGYSRVYYGDGC